MTEQSIISDDMTLKRMFQDFYRVPDYQREYPQSKYLLTRCQASNQSGQVGVADKITTAAKSLEVFPHWNSDAVQKRQAFLARLATTVWDVEPKGGAASA